MRIGHVTTQRNSRATVLLLIILAVIASDRAVADQAQPGEASSDGAVSGTPSSTITLALGDVGSLARAADERLTVAVLESRRAEAVHRSARNERIPAFVIGAGYERLRETDPPTLDLPVPGSEVRLGDSVADRINLQAQIRHELLAGSRTAQIAVTDHRLQATRYQRDFVADQVELAAVELYLNAVLSEERVKVAVRALERASRVRVETEHLLREGLATANDVLRARMAETQAETGLARMQNGRERELLRLKRGLGIDPRASILLDHTPGERQDALPGVDEVDMSISRAIWGRADLLGIEQEILAAGQSVRVAEAGFYPAANIVAGVRYARPSPVAFPQVAEFDYTWSVGFELTFNVGSLAHVRSRAEEARLAEQTLRVERNRRKMDVALQVRSAALDIADAAEQRTAAETFVEQAAENVRTLEAMHAEGLIRLSDVIEAQELMEQAEMNLLEAKIDRELAEARYRFVTGGLALP